MTTRLLAATGLLLALAATAACGRTEAATTTAAAPVPDRVARGQYLVAAMACNDCHTPWIMGAKGPEPDLKRFMSGHPEGVKMADLQLPPGHWAGSPGMTAFQGPWGKSYAANLTPDVNTGLGIWTEDMFLRAIREGRHMGQSRPIMPPMPWPAFRNLSDEDLKSVFAYLKSLPPITNHVPDYEPPAEHDEK